MTNHDNEFSLWTLINSPLFIVLLSTIVINGSIYIHAKFSQGVQEIASTPRRAQMFSLNQTKIKGEIVLRLENLENTLNKTNNVNSFLRSVKEYTSKDNSFYVFPEFRDDDLISLSYKYRELIINNDYVSLADEENDLLKKLAFLQRSMYALRLNSEKDITSEKYNDIYKKLLSAIQELRKKILTSEVEISFWKAITNQLSR